MTLYTKVAITSPNVDPQAAFTKLMEILDGSEYLGREVTDVNGDKVHTMMIPGIGLGALASMMYNVHGGDVLQPIYDEETYDLDQADGEELFYTPTAFITLGFDTGYAYKGDNGAGCGDYHAWIIQELGEWLDSQGATWTWYDESGYGWKEEWDHLSANDLGPNISKTWGTLGDPDFGNPKSMIPVPTRDRRQALLEDLFIPFIEGEEVEWEGFEE